jgi:hypothetical protein
MMEWKFSGRRIPNIVFSNYQKVSLNSVESLPAHLGEVKNGDGT